MPTKPTIDLDVIALATSETLDATRLLRRLVEDHSMRRLRAEEKTALPADSELTDALDWLSRQAVRNAETAMAATDAAILASHRQA